MRRILPPTRCLRKFSTGALAVLYALCPREPTLTLGAGCKPLADRPPHRNNRRSLDCLGVHVRQRGTPSGWRRHYRVSSAIARNGVGTLDVAVGLMAD